MSGRDEGRGGETPRTWLRGVLVIVVIAALLGVFGTQETLKRPQLGALQFAGIAVMLIGLAAVLLAGRLVDRLKATDRERAIVAIKLSAVAVCVAGALMVFI